MIPQTAECYRLFLTRNSCPILPSWKESDELIDGSFAVESLCYMMNVRGPLVFNAILRMRFESGRALIRKLSQNAL